jgi:hypothetical protein
MRHLNSALNTFTLEHPDYVMKLSPESFLRVMASLVVAAVMVAPASAQNTKSREAMVTALAGDARYSSGGGASAPVALGTRLHEGDVLTTTAGSHIDIDLGDNVGILQLAPNSTLALRTLKSTRTDAELVTETDTDLKKGMLYFKVNKLAKASRFEISTPKGIAGIRGTSGSITADGQFTINEGLGGIAYPNNGGVNTFVVHDGETVGPDGNPPQPAPGEVLRDIVEALRDAATHGIGHDIQPFVPPIEIFTSPVLPGR